MTSRASFPPVVALASGLAMGVLGACAQQEVPPGGPEDRRPPVIVRTEPEAYATLDEVDAVRFEFDERISERVSGGALDDAVTVSPRGGEVRVGHGRRSITVRLEEGFQPGLVYRVTLKAVVSDMFGNQLADPFELVFSTGAEAVPTTLAGEVWDRLSGSGTRDALVYATDASGVIHQATTDRAGIFALRYLPAGAFTITAFEDVNRNGEVDSMEVQGSTTAELAEGDTLLIDMSMLAPDTAAAVLVDAEALDSVTVVLEFDDYLEPTADVDQVTASLDLPGGEAPAIIRLFHEADYAEYVETTADSLARLDSIDAAEASRAAAAARAATEAAAAADSVAGTDSTGIDAGGQPPTGGQDAPPLRARRVAPTVLPPLQGSAPGPTPDGRRVLPGKRLVGILDGFLLVDTTYTAQADGVVNINGMPGGGGSVDFERELPPPDTTLADSLAVDGLAVDTLAVDTVGVDTLGVDTLGVGERGR